MQGSDATTENLPGFTIDRGSPIPPSAQLASHLREAIVQGVLAPGRQIPTRKQIEQIAGLSRDTIRKAIRKLKAEGLIEYSPGMGLFVVGLKDLPAEVANDRSGL